MFKSKPKTLTINISKKLGREIFNDAASRDVLMPLAQLINHSELREYDLHINLCIQREEEVYSPKQKMMIMAINKDRISTEGWGIPTTDEPEFYRSPDIQALNSLCIAGYMVLSKHRMTKTAFKPLILLGYKTSVTLERTYTFTDKGAQLLTQYMTFLRM